MYCENQDSPTKRNGMLSYVCRLSRLFFIQLNIVSWGGPFTCHVDGVRVQLVISDMDLEKNI